ncbi:MAG: hypothetical protein RL077_1483 [Verrucomicrobiota bacterium]
MAKPVARAEPASPLALPPGHAFAPDAIRSPLLTQNCRNLLNLTNPVPNSNSREIYPLAYPPFAAPHMGHRLRDIFRRAKSHGFGSLPENLR